MKLIEAVIQPRRLEEVKESLGEVEVFRMTLCEVRGFGRERAIVNGNRKGAPVPLARKLKLQIAVNDDFVEATIQAILRTGRSGGEGRHGDGKIFVSPLDDVIRLRTGERGPEAV